MVAEEVGAGVQPSGERGQRRAVMRCGEARGVAWHAVWFKSILSVYDPVIHHHMTRKDSSPSIRGEKRDTKSKGRHASVRVYVYIYTIAYTSRGPGLFDSLPAVISFTHLCSTSFLHCARLAIEIPPSTHIQLYSFPAERMTSPGSYSSRIPPGLTG